MIRKLLSMAPSLIFYGLFSLFRSGSWRLFLCLSLLPALFWDFYATSPRKIIAKPFPPASLRATPDLSRRDPPTLKDNQIFYRVQHSDEIWMVRYHHDGTLSAILYWRPYYEYDWHRQNQNGKMLDLSHPRPLIGLPVLIDVKPVADQKNIFKGNMYSWQRGLIFRVQIRRQDEKLIIRGSRRQRTFSGFGNADLISLILNPVTKSTIPPVPDTPTPLFTPPPGSNIQ